MEKALAQSQSKNYKGAVDFYTEALDVSTEEQAWRALVSRATTYQMMGLPDAAIKDYTTIIDSQNAPEKKLAYIYSCRARLYQDKKDMAMACADVNKARELGLPETLMQGINCK